MNIKKIIYSLLILLTAVSCDKEPDTLTLGEEMMKSSSRLVMIDTISINMSTVVLDSIPTSGGNLLLAGVFNDDKLGKIVAKSYFQVGFPNYSLDEDEIYDSISLIISYDGYSFGDTTVMQNLTVRKLSERLKLKDQSYFYNTSSLDYEENPVGEISFYPRPSSKRKIAISLDKSFGQELFDYISDAKDDEFKKNEFNDFFKGLAIVTDEMKGNSILGYTVKDTSLLVKIYTHTVEAEEVKREINLPVSNTSLQFNQINCDWSNNMVFNNHTQKNAIPASETDDITYVNAGLGMFTKMTFPYLSSLVEFENAVLVRAILYFKPAYGANMDLPSADKFALYHTGKNNSLDAILALPNGTALRPVLNIDELYNEKTWYSINITDHMIRELSDHYIDPDKALSVSFTSSTVSRSLDQLLLGGGGNKITNPKLELLFLFYELE